MIKENYWYKKEYAQFISGVAVLLMVVHHFFGFRSYLLSDVSWTSLCQLGGIEVERIVGAFGKICVSLYAFNTGYAMWVNRGHYQKKRCDVNRILKFLVSYWVVCLLFYLYAIAVGDRNPSGTDLLLILVGLATGPIDTYVNVSFAWYVNYYILFIAYARLWLCFFSTNRQSLELLVIFVAIVVNQVLSSVPADLGFLKPLPMGLFGIYAAKHHVFEFLSRRLRTFPSWILVGFIPILILIRQGSILVQENVSQLFKSVMGGNICCTPVYIYNYCVSHTKHKSNRDNV